MEKRASIIARRAWAGTEGPGDRGELPTVQPAQRVGPWVGPQGCGDLGGQKGQDVHLKGRMSQRSTGTDGTSLIRVV